jgi:1-acyl-sn-glycerol-3-phosphate acyltransferase
MLRQVYLLGRIGLAGLAFLSFWVGGVLIGVVVFPLTHWRHRRASAMEQAVACQRWVQRSFVMLHAYMRGCGLLHFQPRMVDASVPGTRFVMVANHPTLVDVAALAAVFGRITCIAKRPLFRTPILGAILRSCGYIDGGNGDALSGAVVVSRALELLDMEMPVLVFPEGTRSPAGGLGRLKRGAFEIACRANVPLLPVVIRCEPAALSKSHAWYQIPPRTAFFTVTRLPPMFPDDFQRDAARMAAGCEASFREQLNLPPKEPTPQMRTSHERHE